MKKSKYAPWLRTISSFTITASVLVGIGYSFAYSNNTAMIILTIAFVFMSIFSGLLLLVVSEVLEYLQHITKQLDDLYSQKERNKQRFDKII